MMANSDDMRFVITTADGTKAYEGTGSVSSSTWTGVNTGDWVDPSNPYSSQPSTWDMTLSTPTMPPELLVCQICGEEDVIVFCEACREVLKLARKVWAQQILKEIEDDLS